MGARIVLAAGGTAGHVNPMLATAAALKSLDESVELTAVGTKNGMEAGLVPAAGLEFRTLERAAMPRRLNLQAVTFPKKISQSIVQADRILAQADAQAVIGYGGYVSTPIYLAARKRHIPIVIHEQNARPGMANRLGAKFADVVALTFPSTPLSAKHGSTVHVGLPLRSQIVDLAHARQDPHEREQLRARAAAKFGLDPAHPILLVTGGSSGALHLNEVVASAASEISAAGVQVLHLTGKGKGEAVQAAIAGRTRQPYVVREYLNEMEDAYAIADFVVTRSGAGMVAELSALGIPAVFVPLPIGNGEQALNAADVVKAGGALMVENKAFTHSWFLDHTLLLLGSKKLEQMAQLGKSISPLDAAEHLAKLALEAAQAGKAPKGSRRARGGK